MIDTTPLQASRPAIVALDAAGGRLFYDGRCPWCTRLAHHVG
jgi:hypothetical protein